MVTSLPGQGGGEWQGGVGLWWAGKSVPPLKGWLWQLKQSVALWACEPRILRPSDSSKTSRCLCKHLPVMGDGRWKSTQWKKTLWRSKCLQAKSSPRASSLWPLVFCNPVSWQTGIWGTGRSRLTQQVSERLGPPFSIFCLLPSSFPSSVSTLMPVAQLASQRAKERDLLVPGPGFSWTWAWLRSCSRAPTPRSERPPRAIQWP